MPVTLKIVNHVAKAWSREKVSSAEALLKAACRGHRHERCKRLIQTSFSDSGNNAHRFRDGHISQSSNGFVQASILAYSHHHHLVIRPEDVWFAITTQLSFYINAHAEELRSLFVAHEGQKELLVLQPALDAAEMAQQMTAEIAKNVIDPELRDWIMPSFTTTTYCDKTVGSILFMGTMQKYFTYACDIFCGLPSITLLGEVDDWKDIRKRLDKLDTFGNEPATFAKMLRPILKYMVMSFEEPDNEEVDRFWNHIAHENYQGSGSSYISGWLTAFCFWDSKGHAMELDAKNTHFDGVSYPTVDTDEIPSGYASVPVKVNDNGYKYKATLVAGSVGIAATPSGAASAPSQDNESQLVAQASPLADATSSSVSDDQPTNASTLVRDTIQPVSGWWMCENEPQEVEEARDAERKRIQTELKEAEIAQMEYQTKCLDLYRKLRDLDMH